MFGEVQLCEYFKELSSHEARIFPYFQVEGGIDPWHLRNPSTPFISAAGGRPTRIRGTKSPPGRAQ